MTATGKTGLSLALAEAIGDIEIISADSRQVYRGMDVGTAKVAPEARRRIAHHGLDLVDPDEDFTVADFTAHAHEALGAIASRRRAALLVGGTGLYLRAVARGVPIDQTGRDPAVRERVEGRLVGEGLHVLVAELRGTAPAVADATDLANPRRVVRALERVAIHGDRPPPAPSGYPGRVLWLGLSIDAPTHRRWIEDRAHGQFSGGLIDEAKSLLARYPASLPAFSAIGYREAFDVLAGRRTEADGAEAAAGRTWAYARRQRTWFRKEADVIWLDAAERSAREIAIDRVRRFLDGA